MDLVPFNQGAVRLDLTEPEIVGWGDRVEPTGVLLISGLPAIAGIPGTRVGHLERGANEDKICRWKWIILRLAGGTSIT